jgi:hypothetical protein
MDGNLDFLEIVALFRARKTEDQGSYEGPNEKHVSLSIPVFLTFCRKLGEIRESVSENRKITG